MYDSDEAFVVRFTEYINNAALPYTALAFSDEEALRGYIDGHRLDLLVLAEEIAVDTLQIPVLYLSRVQTEEENAIYRYRRSDHLAGEIAAYFRRIVPESSTGKTDVYMVYSPVGRSGKTTLALELARQLSGSIYIGMETYDSLQMAEGNFGQLLYSIMKKEEDILDELSAVRTPYHGSYIAASPVSYYDLRVLDYEHLSWFLEKLRKAAAYSAVILDVDAGVFDDMELLRCGDRLLVPVLPGKNESARLHSMEQAMKMRGYQELYEHMELLELPDWQTERGKLQEFVKELLG